MRLGYDLTIEQTQKLVMTPELIQAIQILQYNTQELDSFVEEQLLVNPVLESGTPEVREEGVVGSTVEETATGETGSDGQIEPNIDQLAQMEEKKDNPLENRELMEYIKERGYDDISYKQWEYSNDEDDGYSFEQFTTSEVTLTDHLISQLQFAPIKKSCHIIGEYIIESLDENGYMTLTVEEIAKACNVAVEKIVIVLEAIQTFEPYGVGARDLKECLLIQLENLGLREPTIETVINKYLEDLAANRLNTIAKDLGICTTEAQEICDTIRSLEPKPGRQFASQSSTRYIVPDVMVEKVDDEYVVTVNETSSPKLMISSYYRNLLTEAESDPNLSKFLSSKLNSALWLIKSIEQRKQTIYNVVSAVVKYQKDFFDQGTKHLKTLTLKQIAEEVGIHESTVSRSINGKYMQSPRGVFEIKYFFTSGVSGNQGEGISSESIKSFIKEIIADEDQKSPHSDQFIAEVLGKKGMDISRRTVAKYRDELKIPSSSKRRRY